MLGRQQIFFLENEQTKDEGFTDANSLNEPKFTVTLINPRVWSEIRLVTLTKTSPIYVFSLFCMSYCSNDARYVCLFGLCFFKQTTYYILFANGILNFKVQIVGKRNQYGGIWIYAVGDAHRGNHQYCRKLPHTRRTYSENNSPTFINWARRT